IDDDEPVYCYCNRVSFGKMLACENDACEGGEWFHFACLGLTGAPKGKWYCDTCR
ncbi:the Ing1 Phd finger in complex with A histone H3k4me3 peptide, partial [Protomyces lactucae-debilis]